MKKPLPVLTSDEEAERFVEEADLGAYDWSALKPTRFVLTAVENSVTVPLGQATLDRATEQAKARSLPLERYLGELLERALAS